MERSSGSTNGHDPVTLDSMLCFAIYATGHAFTRFYRPRLDALDLTYPQYLVMMVLWERDDVTVGQLGDRLFLDSGTVTPLLKRLATRGLVVRRRDPKDERVVRITLTGEGRRMREAASAIPLEIADGAGLSVERIDALRQDLLALRETLDDSLAGRAPK